MKRLNLCCGDNKITGAYNVDAEASCKPDAIVDIKKPLPFEDDAWDEIYFFHAIEHIEKYNWYSLLSEIRRVLSPTGTLYMSYPEFSKIATNWLENKQGNREFWEHTIYGLQRYPGDYHVSVVNSPDLRLFMEEIGFENVTYKPEPKDTFNTVMKAQKGVPAIPYEKLLYDEVFTK